MVLGRKKEWLFYLFGGLRIERGGGEVDLPPYRCQRALIYLLLNLGYPVRRERMAGDLYPDLSPDRARARLSDHLWLIKSTLPELLLDSFGDDVQIVPSCAWVDCHDFFDGISGEETKAMLAAVQLYKGDLVPDLYDDWLLLFRERFRSGYLNTLLTLASRFEKLGQHTRVSEMLERLLIEEPFDEAAVRQLMRAYARMGRRGLALSTYERYRLLCLEQLDAQPDSKTQFLYESLLERSALPRQATEPRNSRDRDHKLSLRRAETALNEGDRFQLLNLLRSASSVDDPKYALKRDLLHIDEAIQWDDMPRAWQLLDAITSESGQVELRRALLSIEQHDLEGARQILERLLKDAASSYDRELEANVLMNLSVIKMHKAEFQDALLVINRSIGIASRLDNTALLVKAYLQKGKILYRQGTNNDARDALLQAQSLAEGRNFNCLLAEIDLFLGGSLQRSGRYLNAYSVYIHALETARDVGLKRIEAQILLGLAAVCDYLGRNEESLQALNTAREIYRKLNDKIGLAKVDYNLAAAIPYHDEDHCEEAIQHARFALEVFDEADLLEWQAVTHTALAFALWIMEDYREAVSHYERSVMLHRMLGENNFIPELYAYIGLAYLGMKNIPLALDWTERAFHEQTMLNLSDIVADIFYARGAALEASRDLHAAKNYYMRAYQTLLDFAQDIEEEDARQAYFHRDPITRRLMKKIYEYGFIPQANQIVVKRNISGWAGGEMDVVLMVDAGASDQALARGKGDAVVRRVRLQRLLNQAERQRIHLTLEEIAQALNVSKRTVQRDLDTLEAHQ